MAKRIRKSSKERFKFGKINVIFMILAILFLIVGYVIIDSAPNIGTILLVIGYIVLIPLSLLVKSYKGDNSGSPAE